MMLFQGERLTLSREDDGIAELCFDAGDGAVNKFDAATLDELRAVVDCLQVAEGVRTVFVRSAREQFIVGADIKRFPQVFTQPLADFRARMQRNHRLFSDFENLPFASVALVHGLALGGGFEFCLACDFRVMADDARVGLPETTLGIFPGWGGTIRLPHLVGIDEAVAWIADGRPRDADAALAAGAVDAVAPRAGLRAAARVLVDGDDAASRQHRRQQRRAPLLPDAHARERIFTALRQRHPAASDGHYPALGIALDAMAQHTAVAREAAVTLESEAFLAAARTPTAASLVHLFLRGQVERGRLRALAGEATAATRVGIVGAGVMGRGIAAQCLLRGIEVDLHDHQAGALTAALEHLDAVLDAEVRRGRLEPRQADAARARLRRSERLEDLGDCDFVIEAVVEDAATKQQVFAALNACLGDHVVLASNTSTVPVGRLASAADAGRVVGLHFFHPVSAMALVEVVRGAGTDPATVSRAVALAHALGKQPVVVADCAGFYVNRVLFAYLLAFEDLLRDGVAHVRIDRVMTAHGWPMGPAQLLDMVGLDTRLQAGAVMAAAYPDRMAPSGHGVCARLVAAGRLGVKSRAGFYRYEDGPVPLADATVADILPTRCTDGSDRRIDDDDIVERMMMALTLEVVRCLDDGIVDGPGAADLALVQGLGFPRYLGGPLNDVDRVGAAALVERAARCAALGAAFRVPPSLLRMAKDGGTFFEVSGAAAP